MIEKGTYDLETGEIGSNIFIQEIEDIQRKKDFIDMRKSKDAFNEWIAKEYGGFCFFFYDMIDKGLKKQYIIRFLYLCTYMDYKNNLLYGNAKGDDRYMLEKDLKEVLKLGKTETLNTKNILIANGLIKINENNNISIISDYCLKGTIPNNKRKLDKIRIFKNAIQELYDKAKPSEHKKLGLLIELLPYINLKFNVVCENPECELWSEIIPISLTKLANLMGYSNNKTSTQKLKYGLFNIIVNGEMAIMIHQTAKGAFVTVNPRTYYKGTTLADVKFLFRLFSVSDKL